MGRSKSPSNSHGGPALLCFSPSLLLPHTHSTARLTFTRIAAFYAACSTRRNLCVGGTAALEMSTAASQQQHSAAERLRELQKEVGRQLQFAACVRHACIGCRAFAHSSAAGLPICSLPLSQLQSLRVASSELASMRPNASRSVYERQGPIWFLSSRHDANEHVKAKISKLEKEAKVAHANAQLQAQR